MPADGSQTNFEFSFSGGYIDPAYIAVTLISVGGVETLATFTWAGSSTINISPAPPAGSTVRIRRLTPVGSPLVDFTNGAVVTEANLDLIAKQAIQGAADAADSGLIAASDLRKDASGFKLWSPSGMVAWFKAALLSDIGDELRGPIGLQGVQGPQGTLGPQGPQGVPGIQGPVGPQGPQGNTGLVGPKGDTGSTGANATNPAITVQANKLAPGSNPTAVISGSYPNLLLTLGLVTGDTGHVDVTGAGGGVWGAISGTLTDQTDLMNKFATKADASSLSAYALTTDMTNALSAKANASDLSSYATAAALSSGLSAKVNTTDLNSTLTNYATITALNDGLTAKVNTSDLNSTLSSYATTASLANGLAGKADTSALSVYALTSDVNNALSAKANNSALASYVLTTDFNSALAGKADVGSFATVAQVNAKADAYIGFDTPFRTANFSLTDAMNNQIVTLDGTASRTITAPTLGGSGAWSCIIHNQTGKTWTLTASGGLFKPGVTTAPTVSGTIAAGGVITLIHRGSGYYIVRGDIT